MTIPKMSLIELVDFMLAWLVKLGAVGVVCVVLREPRRKGFHARVQGGNDHLVFADSMSETKLDAFANVLFKYIWSNSKFWIIIIS